MPLNPNEVKHELQVLSPNLNEQGDSSMRTEILMATTNKDTNQTDASSPKRNKNLKLNIIDKCVVVLPSNLGPGTVVDLEFPRKNMHHTVIIVNGSLTNCVINFNM